MFSWSMMLLAIGVQQSDSVICVHVSVLFQILFPFGFLQSSLCYIVGPYRLSNLYIATCICQTQTLSLSLPTILPPGNHKVIFKVYEVCFAYELICIICPYASAYKQYHIICLPLSDFFHLVQSSPGLSMFAASGITSFCLVLSDAVCIYQCLPPSNSLSSFSYDIQASGGQLQLKALVPAPSFAQLPLPHFSCAHRGTSASGVCFCGHTLSDVVLLALFLGEWQPDILPSHLLQPLPGIYFVFFIPL